MGVLGRPKTEKLVSLRFHAGSLLTGLTGHLGPYVVMSTGDPRVYFSPPAPVPAATRTRSHGYGIPSKMPAGLSGSRGSETRAGFSQCEHRHDGGVSAEVLFDGVPATPNALSLYETGEQGICKKKVS